MTDDMREAYRQARNFIFAARSRDGKHYNKVLAEHGIRLGMGATLDAAAKALAEHWLRQRDAADHSSDAALVAAYIAKNGVRRMPTAFVLPTSAAIQPKDRVAIRAHINKTEIQPEQQRFEQQSERRARSRDLNRRVRCAQAHAKRRAERAPL